MTGHTDRPPLRIQGAIALATVIALAGCGGLTGVSGSGNASQAPNAQAANAYLATGALPERPGLVNATCAATPDPTPTS